MKKKQMEGGEIRMYKRGEDQSSMVGKRDVQNEVVESVALNRVGLKGVRMPIIIHRPESDREVIINANLYLSLPKDQRGAHLSRLVQAMEENLVFPKETRGIEWLARSIADDIKRRSEYCEFAEVELWAEREAKGEVYKLLGYAKSGEKPTLGVEVIGATCCPCAREMCKNGVAHNQRCTLRIEVEVLTELVEVSAEELVEIAHKSFSSPVYNILKRPDEKRAVEYMHENTKFVEDVVRDAVEQLKELDVHWCKVECDSQESIHPFDAYSMFEGKL